MAGPTIKDMLDRGSALFSFEFFPAKTDEGERQLWTAIRQLEPLHPDFVSVTYGAGGSTRDRTIAMTERIATDTTLLPLAHLTAVDHSVAELRRIVGSLAAAGVHNVLALRGDPPGDPQAEWVKHREGLEYAHELVQLVKASGEFCVGVAAFPERHPESATLDHDARVLAAKQEAGAEFAVTQLFFRSSDYADLVARVRAMGCDIPILPGIMPITNLRQVTRMAELSGADLPDEVVARFDGLEDPADVRRVGVAVATELCEQVLDLGAPGLHFYTLNRSKATLEIFEALRITV